PHCIALLLIFHSFSSTTPSPPSISTLSLHDALPISRPLPETAPHLHMSPRLLGEAVDLAEAEPGAAPDLFGREEGIEDPIQDVRDRKSTRLNSSHVSISYAVFCLKKKKK